MNSKLIALCVSGIIAAFFTAPSKADLIVSGVEIAPGQYEFTFSQGAGTDPIQNKSFIPLNFTIDLPGLVPGSPMGSLTDGSTVLTQALSGWSDASLTAPMINPNLINSSNSGPLLLTGDAGINFSVTNVSWTFASQESIDGTPLIGFVQSIPEPSAAVVLALGLSSLVMRRRRFSNPK